MLSVFLKRRYSQVTLRLWSFWMRKYFAVWIILLLTFSAFAQENQISVPFDDTLDGGRVLINSVDFSTSLGGVLAFFSRYLMMKIR